MAGQIPLVPRSMEVVREVREGAVLALQHLDRIWEAVGAVGCAGVAWVVGEEAVAGVLGAWGGRGRVMVVEAEELPRGAGVEWVGIGMAEEGGERGVEMVFADGGLEEVVSVLRAGGGVKTVYLPVRMGSVQEFLRAWGGEGVAVVPVGGVWDGEGRRRGMGCVVRVG